MTMTMNPMLPASLPVAAAPPTPADMGSAQATATTVGASTAAAMPSSAPAPASVATPSSNLASTAAANGGGLYDAYTGANYGYGGYTYAPYNGGYTTSYSYPASTSYGTANATGGVQIPSSSFAPRRPKDYWTSHIAQFAGAYLPDGPSMRPNCGPASTTMALRMIGLDIPGFNGQRSEAVLDAARYYATGSNDPNTNTSGTQLKRLVATAGGRTMDSSNFGQLTSWVKQGVPVILNGNPSKGWDHRYNASQVYPFDGAHWVTVSGYDQATGFYIVNDPLSQIGPIYVSEAELANYTAATGGFGMGVIR